MSKKFIMPAPDAISELLCMVFGDGVKTSKGKEGSAKDSYIATFVDDDDKLVALCASDLPFVAYASAALSMIPAAVANDMIKEKDLNDTVIANFHEIMNICSKLMMSDDSDHLRLLKTLDPAEAEKTVADFTATSTGAFAIDIPKYGIGNLTFYIGE